jgi:hypothetical protein
VPVPARLPEKEGQNLEKLGMFFWGCIRGVHGSVDFEGHGNPVRNDDFGRVGHGGELEGCLCRHGSQKRRVKQASKQTNKQANKQTSKRCVCLHCPRVRQPHSLARPLALHGHCMHACRILRYLCLRVCALCSPPCHHHTETISLMLPMLVVYPSTNRRVFPFIFPRSTTTDFLICCNSPRDS